MIVLLLVACATSAVESPMTPNALLDALVTLTAGPPTPQRVEEALSVTLEPAVGTEVLAKFTAESGTFSEIIVFEARGTGTTPHRVHLIIAGPCVPFEAAKARFGFAHGVPDHPGAPSADGERFQHQLPAGRLFVTYRGDCLREATFEANRD
jgi:hypothetical protein